MTEANPSIQYLTRAAYEAIHAELAQWAREVGEPVPPLAFAKSEEIEALVKLPRHQFFGFEQYPTIAEKAAIIFYSINKRQMFLNGNKRMSTLSLLVFLGINGYRLDVSPDALRDKALWLAQTESQDFMTVRSDLVSWIQERLRQQEGAES